MNTSAKEAARDAVAVLEGTPTLDANQTSLHSSSKETAKMLLYEDLARVRMREAERDAERRRQANQLLAAKRWRRLATWTARRAASAEIRARGR